MNKNDIVVFGKWDGSGYGEYFAIVRGFWGGVTLRYVEQGEVSYEFGVKLDENAVEGEDYYRETMPGDFTDDSPVSGQVVWVSYSREGGYSDILQGIVLSSPVAFADVNSPLRATFGRRTRTLLPQSQATACDSFWAVDEPTPVYCDDN